MWMSNVLIVVDGRNADHNSVREIAAAVAEAGATIVGVDEQSCVIEAALPAHELPTITAMEGVSYVRCVFNYHCNERVREAA